MQGLPPARKSEGSDNKCHVLASSLVDSSHFGNFIEADDSVLDYAFDVTTLTFADCVIRESSVPPLRLNWETTALEPLEMKCSAEMYVNKAPAWLKRRRGTEAHCLSCFYSVWVS